MRPLIAGNWKMNKLGADGAALAAEIAARRGAAGDPGCDLLVCPPAVLLAGVAAALAGSAVALGAQDCHAADSGAHTGDISAAMLADAGCAYVIVGHSERRTDHGETDATVKAKAEAALRHGLTPIVCVGETLDERDGRRTLDVVGRQIAGSLPDGATGGNVVIAYEPVWAIGTGRTPTAGQIAEVHAHIRGALGAIAGGAETRLLYGGSMKPDNAREILAIEHVNGGLIGGASLQAEDFWSICQAVV